MQPTHGTVVYRRSEGQGGVTETKYRFESLDDLFALVIDAKAPDLIDRVAIFGEDPNGQKRTITFVFQSIEPSHEQPMD